MRLSHPILANAGATALEYGLCLPALLLLTLGTMDIGRLVYTFTTMHRAVEAAARCGAIGACTSGQITARAAAEAWGLGLTPANFVSSVQACGVKVDGNLNFQLLIPWPGGVRPDGGSNVLNLQVSACYPM